MNRRNLLRIHPLDLPVLLAAVLAALAFAMPSAHAAGIDPEVVAQSIAEDGYYIDSAARYLRSDAAQDQLRAQLETAKSPVFVAVIPAGNSLTPAQVYHLAKRKGTYAVLTGGTLKAASNTLPASRVDSALARAVREHRGDPGAAVVAFVHLTNGTTKAPAQTTGRRQASTTPTPEPSAEPSDPASASAAPVAAPERHEGGGHGLLIVGGIVAVLLAAATFYLVYRRGRGQGPKKSPV
ncbi:MAG TPA: hypothetical protein VF069_08305 [Streptosporangiaceae bacterium]